MVIGKHLPSRSRKGGERLIAFESGAGELGWLYFLILLLFYNKKNVLYC